MFSLSGANFRIGVLQYELVLASHELKSPDDHHKVYLIPSYLSIG
jgi:hypothetical protein